MKINRQRINMRRSAIAAAVRDQNVIRITEGFDLRIEGVDFVAPPAVQEDERIAAAGFAVMNRHRPRGGDERGFGDLCERHTRSVFSVMSPIGRRVWYGMLCAQERQRSAPTAMKAEEPNASTVADIASLQEEIIACTRCPRLVTWREQVAREKVRRFADEEYWGRPVPSLGEAGARLLIVGLAPAAHGGNRTGRMFTGDRSGDVLYAALHEVGLASGGTSVSADDGLELYGVLTASACGEILDDVMPEIWCEHEGVVSPSTR